MKYKSFIVILLLLACNLLQAQSIDEQALLDKSETTYAAGNYDSSLVYLSQLSQEGYRSFELFYNLGNVHYKLGNIPEAILYYEKAKKLRPNEDDLNYNLELANSKITDHVKELPNNQLVTFIAGSLATDVWAIMSVLAFFIFLILLFLFFYLPYPAQKSLFLRTSMVTLLLSVLLFFMASQRKIKLDDKQEAIIMAPTVTVTSAPSESGKRLFVIHEGLKVEILDEQGKYAKIRLADGNVGWVEIESFTTI